MSKPVLFEVCEGVAHITLNRPDDLNALDIPTARALMEAATHCERAQSVRAVLLRGNGTSFCVGGDIKAFARSDGLPEMMRELTTTFHLAVSRLFRLEAPVIAAVRGATAGGGLGMVCAADIVLAADTAVFRLAYSGIGLTMDGGTTYFLPRLVGRRRAAELALTNRSFSAAEAAEIGFVNQVVPDEELDASAEALTLRLAAGPTWAYGRTKSLLNRGWSETLESQMELESRCITEACARADGREGIAAFLEKREARYSGA